MVETQRPWEMLTHMEQCQQQELQQENAQLRADNTLLQQEIAQLRAEKEERRTKYNDLLGDADGLTGQVRHLETEGAAMQARIERIEAENLDLRQLRLNL